MNAIERFEQEQIKKLTENKDIPDFKPGDTVRVDVRIVEATTERIQAYEGVVIAIKRRGIDTSFVVRKISHNEGVERRFNLYSPMLSKITIIRRGAVRRAKLYYLRALRGKAARIKEKVSYHKK